MPSLRQREADGELGGRHHAAEFGYAILMPPSLVGCFSDFQLQVNFLLFASVI